MTEELKVPQQDHPRCETCKHYIENDRLLQGRKFCHYYTLPLSGYIHKVSKDDYCSNHITMTEQKRHQESENHKRFLEWLEQLNPNANVDTTTN